MKDKIRKIISIVLFFAVLWVPLCTFQKPGHASVVENKMTATMPALTKSSLLQKEWVEGIESCISDNMGMKESATLLYISGMYRMFDEISISNYLKGKDNHIFYLTDEMLSNFEETDPIDYESYISVLNSLDRSFAERGCEFIFMPIPNKESIYWDSLPDDIYGSPENCMFHKLSQQIDATSDINLVHVEQKMLEHEQDGEMLYYYNYDPTHWNAYGMYVGYQALMEEMQQIDASIIGLGDQDVVISKQEVRQALAYLQSYPLIQSTFSDLTDYMYNINPVDGWHGVQDNTVPNGFVLAGDTQDRYFHYSNPSARNDGCLVIYGDSYIYSFMLPLLSETFSEVYFISANACGTTELADLFQYVQPDYFLFEAVGRQVPYYKEANSSRLQELLSAIQSALDASQG